MYWNWPTYKFLIDRERLFGNPSRAQGQLSPNGRWISWIAPVGGILNLWAAPADRPDQGRVLTKERERPIQSYFWSPDSRQLLFVNDEGGDENFRLFSVDVERAQRRTLTRQNNVQVRIVGVSRDIHDYILIGVNERDPRWHDIYRLDLDSGESTLVLQNDGYGEFVVDTNLDIRLVQCPREDGGYDFFRLDNGAMEETPFAKISFEDSANTVPAGFTRDGKTLYWIDSRGRDKAALTAQNIQTGELHEVATSSVADVTGAMVDPKTREIQAWAVNYLRTEWHAIDPVIDKDLTFLRERLVGDVHVTSRTNDDRYWLVVNDPVTAPPETHRYDRARRELTALFVSRPELVGAELAGMTPVEITARDGTRLTAYLTTPPGINERDPISSRVFLPTVLLVHGGPWARDSYGSNVYHHWLADRGYAVLSVNFRGSTGFGKSFIAAGNGEWGQAMHHDLIDAVNWAIDEGVADRERIAIMGGSYGGYAALAGLTFTPEIFACGIDIVGPSNLATLLDSIPPYWEAARRQMYRRMADPNTEAGQAWLTERSPLTYAGRIVRPLLIGQGANDPRVKQAESDQIVAALAERSIPVTYVLFPDEGHGFAQPANNIAFHAIVEAFLQKHLGGRAEPIGDTWRSSTATVPYGADDVPGLLETLNTASR